MIPIKTILDMYLKDHSIIYGYYGYGNFGDELIFNNVVQYIKYKKFLDVEVYYNNKNIFSQIHPDISDHSNKLVNIKQLFYNMFFSKNIYICGGGLFGLDSNIKFLIFSLLVATIKLLINIDVYLISVGYYNSTNKLGHMSAKVLSSISKVVCVRDEESFKNFKRILKSDNVLLSEDIVFLNNTLAHVEIIRANKYLPYEQSSTKQIVFTLRDFNDMKLQLRFISIIERVVLSLCENEKNIHIHLCIPSIKEYDTHSHIFAEMLKEKYNVDLFTMSDSIIGFINEFKSKKPEKAVLVQYHLQLVAHKLIEDSNEKYLAIIYDNKNYELLRLLDWKNIVHINDPELENKILKYIRA